LNVRHNISNDSRQPGSTAGYAFSILPIVAELLATQKRSHSDIGLGLRALKISTGLLRHPSGKDAKIMVNGFCGLVGVMAFVGVTAGGILSANVVLDSTALCSSADCGWYCLPRGPPVSRADNPAVVTKYLVEEEAVAAAHEA